jgi:uncharacterized protein YndB with AHSA1/START domain
MTSLRRRAPIIQERLLPAPPEAVFEAWSDPEGLATWMCPAPDMERASVEVDFRVGGSFQILMHGSEQDYLQHGEYLEIEPPKRLVMTWVSEWQPEGQRRTRIEVTCEPAGVGQTRLVLTHDELPDTDSYDGHRQGWATILEKLERHLRKENSG